MNIDTTKPHIGRIYDFVLGGHHNYEVDRQYAEKMISVFPAYPKFARLNRWFLQLVADRWAAQGIKRVLDIGSGLPTQGHLNEYLPDARILFTDNDPLSVSCGGEIIKDNHTMKYVMADIRDPDPLIEEATRFFGDERRVAVGFIGLAYLLADEEVKNLVQRLHAWCAPGSAMAVSYLTPNKGMGETESQKAMGDLTKRLGFNPQRRTAEHLAEVIAPWRVVEARPLDKLLDVEDMVTEDEKTDIGVIMAGAIAEH